MTVSTLCLILRGKEVKVIGKIGRGAHLGVLASWEGSSQRSGLSDVPEPVCANIAQKLSFWGQMP